MIGSNVTGVIQTLTNTKDTIGQNKHAWTDAKTLYGWLDLMSESSRYLDFKTKVGDSDHVFICDYTTLNSGIKAGNARMVVGGNTYDIVYIDNPMGMNRQLEIYLKRRDF